MARSSRSKKTPGSATPDASQLRDDIDRGHTDDESAGYPPTAEQVRPAMAGARGHGAASEAHGVDTATGHRRLAGPAVWLLLIFVVPVLAVLFLVLPA